LPDDNLIGLIPAAGKGSRLGLPFPKELYPTISNNKYKPIANFAVDHLLLAGVTHIVFVINESKHQLIKYFGSGQRFNCHYSYVVQENMVNKPSTSPGLANALAAAYHLIRKKTVLFGMADTIMWPKDAFKVGLDSMRPDVDLTLCLFPTDYPQKFGMVSFSRDMCVKEIIDKPQKTDLSYMWGTMIWRSNFTEFLYKMVIDNISGDFAEIINQSIQDGFKVQAVKFPSGKFVDFGTYEQIQELSDTSQDQ